MPFHGYKNPRPYRFYKVKQNTVFQIHFKFLFGEIFYAHTSLNRRDITFFDLRQIFSFFCHQSTFYKYTVYMEIFQIIQKNNIPTVSRCNCSSVFQVKAFCCVKCCHTNCYHRIKTFLYTDTQMIIKMSFVKDCLRLTVIRTEQASSAVLCCHTFKQCSKVMAC